MTADEEEMWSSAVAWFVRATEADIDAAMALPERERDHHDWLRVAAIAFDQAGIDPQRVAR